MAEAWGRALCVLVLSLSPALAQPISADADRGSAVVPAGIVARAPQTVGDSAQNLFRLGATEIGQAPRGAADDAAADDAAARKFEAGKKSFLNFKTKAAERALSEAVELYLRDPAALPDSGPAVRAVLLLAQVQLARRRGRSAAATLERALVELPGFPGNETPAPDVAGVIKKVRGTLGPRARPLTVTSTPPGLNVRVNGMLVGPAPVKLTVFAPIVVVAAYDSDREIGRQRAEMLRAGTEISFTVGASAKAKAVLAAIGESDAARSWQGAAALGGRICVALIDDEGVLVARLNSTQKQVVGAHNTRRPSNLEGWRALGRYCAQDAPSNGPPGAAQDRLFKPAPVAPIETTSNARDGWGWAATGVGAAAVGVGIYFGLQAKDAEERFNENGRSRDEDSALSNALGADIAYVAGGVLIATGLYLLLTD